MKKLLILLLYASPCMAGTCYTITGCQDWLKASAIVGKIDGDLVTTWADTSGASNDAVAPGGAEPTYKTGILNGKAILRFAGAQLMFTPAYALNQPSTVFIVANDSTAADHTFLGDTVNIGLLLSHADATTFIAYAGSALSQVVPNMTSFGIMGAIFNGASSLSSFNGTTATGDAGATNAVGLCVGDRGAGGFGLQGDIAEVITFDTALSTPNRQLVEGELACSYNLQALLPVGHPYKVTCPGSKHIIINPI